MKSCNENGPIGNCRRKININMPIFPMDKYACASLSGSSNANNFEPSSGGMGSRLKIARNVFILIIFTRMAAANAAPEDGKKNGERNW